MKKVYQKKDAKKDAMGYGLLLAACGVVAMATGCAGIEVGGKLGIYRTDEHREATVTHRNPKPFICYLMPSRCAGAQAQGEVEGS